VEIFGRPGGGKNFAVFGAGVFGSEAGDGGEFQGVGEGAYLAHGNFRGGDIFVLLLSVEVFGSRDSTRGIAWGRLIARPIFQARAT
jgi:hypothetical protein